MNDPYVTLGVARTASDEEIKKAYRDLARKYHPDNYVNNPLADLAQEKMKEINEAYEFIQKERAGTSQSQYGSYSSGASYAYQSRPSTGAFADARSAINSGDFRRAEMILGSITERGAEWHFLMGSLSYRQGWMDSARRYFNTAVSMEPGNPEYRQALNYMNSTAQSPYQQGSSAVANNDMCDICGKLVLADCCCEMMGGDCIRCI